MTVGIQRGMQGPHMNEAYTVCLGLLFHRFDVNKTFFCSQEHVTSGVRESHRKFEIVLSDGTSLTFRDGQRKLTVPVLL